MTLLRAWDEGEAGRTDRSPVSGRAWGAGGGKELTPSGKGTLHGTLGALRPRGETGNHHTGKEQAADRKRSSSPWEETSQSWLNRSEASLATDYKPCCG